jgi:hypothetical protein
MTAKGQDLVPELQKEAKRTWKNYLQPTESASRRRFAGQLRKQIAQTFAAERKAGRTITSPASKRSSKWRGCAQQAGGAVCGVANACN